MIDRRARVFLFRAKARLSRTPVKLHLSRAEFNVVFAAGPAYSIQTKLRRTYVIYLRAH